MFCPGCNTRNSTNNKFCRHCGKPLTDLGTGDRGHAQATGLPSEDGAHGAVAFEDTTAGPGGIEELMRQAYDARNRGALTEAIALAREAASLAPEDVRCYSLLGNLCESAELYEDAIAAYERAVELSPEDKVDRYRLSVIRDRQAPLVRQSTAPALEAALPSEEPGGHEVAPAATASRDSEGRNWGRLLPVAAAVVVFVVSIVGGARLVLRSDKPDTEPAGVALASAGAPAQAHIDRGKFHFERGDYADAANQFILALADSPNDAEAAYWLSETQMQQSAQYASADSDLPADGLPMPAEDENASMGPIAGVAPDGSSGIPPAIGAEQAPQAAQPATGTGQAVAVPVQGTGLTAPPPTAADRGALLSQADIAAASGVPELFSSLADTGGASRQPPGMQTYSSANPRPPAAAVVSPGGSTVSLADEGDAGGGGSSDLDTILGGASRTRTTGARDRRPEVKIIRSGSPGGAGSSVRLAPEDGSPSPSSVGSNSGDAHLMRAYTLRDEGDVAGAREALQTALQQYQRQGGVGGEAGAKVCRDQLGLLGSR